MFLFVLLCVPFLSFVLCIALFCCVVACTLLFRCCFYCRVFKRELVVFLFFFCVHSAFITRLLYIYIWSNRGNSVGNLITFYSFIISFHVPCVSAERICDRWLDRPVPDPSACLCVYVSNASCVASMNIQSIYFGPLTLHIMNKKKNMSDTVVFMRTKSEAVESVECDLSLRIHHSLVVLECNRFV